MRKRTLGKQPVKSRWETGIIGLDSDDDAERAAALFKVLANTVRLQLLATFANGKPVRPVDLALIIDKKTSPFVVYNAMNILRLAGLIASQGRVGWSTYYVITDRGKQAARLAASIQEISEP